MSCDSYKNNKGCGCHNNPSPELPEVADMSMNVCDRNTNMLPMLQTYTTKVLKPNLCCKKNILTQQMMNCEGYKYVIKWDFDLNGQIITVPKNCILEFDGGSLKNGIIVGTETAIESPVVKIFGENLTVEGRWAVSEVYTEWFGALTDVETYDSTAAIQAAIDMANNAYGCVVKLLQGFYYITTLYLKFKTSLVGSGIGCTILKQIDGTEAHGIVLEKPYSCAIISDFTIRGWANTVGDGIYIDGEQITAGVTEEKREYAWTEINTSLSIYATYKRVLIKNICVSAFCNGITTSEGNFGVFITDSYFGENTMNGANLSMTDSTISNCYINNNARNGMLLHGGNNNVYGIKSIFNGISDPKNYYGIYVSCARSKIANCETQDNYGGGYYVLGNNNLFVNCISNNDGYRGEPKGYQDDVPVYGFYIVNPIQNNIFTNCEVTNYSMIHGSLLDSYVKYELYKSIIDPNIFNGIQLSPQNEMAVCKKMTYYNDYALPTVKLPSVTSGTLDIDDNVIPYFGVSAESSIYTYNNAGKFDNNKTSLYLSFILNSDDPDVIAFFEGPEDTYFPLFRDINNTLNVFLYKRSDGSIFIYMRYGSASTSLGVLLDDNSIGKPITLLLTLNNKVVKHQSFVYRQYTSGGNHFEGYVYTRGFYNFIRVDAPDINKWRLQPHICYNKIVITNESIPTTLVCPGMSLQPFRSNALLYISADNLQYPIVADSGSYASRPSIDSIHVGFRYFCTDKTSPEGSYNGIEIIFKGTNSKYPDGAWVDALGRYVDADYPATYKGPFDSKPDLHNQEDVDYQYYDTTNHRIIIWTGVAWVDATGQSV